MQVNKSKVLLWTWIILGTLALLGLVSMACFGQRAEYRKHGAAPLNDLIYTPGKVDPALTKAKLCDPKFHTGTVRNVTQKTKVKVCQAYHAAGKCPGPGYEIDHLISIELGGSNDSANLWPQPLDGHGVIGYHTKDVVENRAHRAVCEGKLSLGEAQNGIATDWYQFGVDNGFIDKDGSYLVITH